MTDLAALARKYEQLIQLRRSREEASSSGLDRFAPVDALARRAVMRALAAEFPGALRELDHLSIDQLLARLDAVREAMSSGETYPWLIAVGRMHALARRRIDSSVRVVRRMDAVWQEIGASLDIDAHAAEQLVFPGAPPRGTRHG